MPLPPHVRSQSHLRFSRAVLPLSFRFATKRALALAVISAPISFTQFEIFSAFREPWCTRISTVRCRV